MFKFFSSRRVVWQLIMIFLIVILVMGLGLGLPAIMIMSRQTTMQLHALLDQSNQTTLALFENKSTQLQNTAILLSERPTLNQLVADQGDIHLVSSYLEEFRKNTRMDLIVVCDSQETIAIAGDNAPGKLCELSDFDQILFNENLGWWLTDANISGSGTGNQRVILGQLMSSIFEEISSQTKLDYLLFQTGNLLTGTITPDNEFLNKVHSSDFSQYDLFKLEDENLDQRDYMASIIPLAGSPDLELIGLLNVGTYLAMNAQLRNLVLIILAGVSIIGTLLAVFISRRFSKPLNQLALSASGIREGDLTTRLTTSSRIWEIEQLTNTLEDARVSLKHSLDQLRREKEWIESLLNSIVEGIITIDDQARITYASEAIERLTGASSAAMLGQPVDRFFAPSMGEDVFSNQIPSSNQNRRIPVIINGHEVLLAVSSSKFVPPEAGNATRALVIRDVTDEERIHRLMGEFMANITHEFRTPLSALSASVELLMDQLPDLSTPEIQELIQALNVGILNLQSFIDNLIEAASIEGGRFKVNRKPISFQSIIDDATNMIEPIAQKYGVIINQPKAKQTFMVMADQRRTSQALLNLLSNAIKFSPPGGQINLSTVILDREVMIEVSDEGKGVSENRSAQLFNRFISSSDGDSDVDFGLGLGLAVVKAIIEAQDGSVGFKNRQEGGALFWITLPMISDEQQ